MVMLLCFRSTRHSENKEHCNKSKRNQFCILPIRLRQTFFRIVLPAQNTTPNANRTINETKSENCSKCLSTILEKATNHGKHFQIERPNRMLDEEAALECHVLPFHQWHVVPETWNKILPGIVLLRLPNWALSRDGVHESIVLLQLPSGATEAA